MRKNIMAKYLISILLVCSALCFADPKIDKLVDQLGAASFKDRKSAETQLWELLPASEGALRKAVASDDPEINIRARRILDKFEKGILPGVTEEIKLKIEQFWETSKKSLYLRDWLYRSEFKDIKFVIHVMKLAEKKGEVIRISKFLSQRDLFSKIYLMYPNSEEYKFFLRKYAEEGNGEIYANWIRVNGTVKSEIEYYTKHPQQDEERIKSLLVSLYKISGETEKAAELSKNDLHYQYMKLLRKRDFKGILANKSFTQGNHAIGEAGGRLLYHRLSEDKEAYRLAKQRYIDEYASEAKKNIHLTAIHGLISNGEMKEALDISQKIEPVWFTRILTLSTDLEAKLKYAEKTPNSETAAYIAFEYYRLFKKEECKKWLQKAKLSELGDRWLYYYSKAYVYAYGLEEAFNHIAEDFSLIQSNSRRQVYYALCPDFNTLASYVVGYKKAEVRDNFLILKNFVTKKLSGEELEDFYTKVGSNNGRVSEYRMKLVYEAATYLKDDAKLKSFKEDFLRFDANRLYLAKIKVLNQNYEEALKLLENLTLRDQQCLIYLFLKVTCYKGLKDTKNLEKYLALLKKAPVNHLSLSEEFLDFLEEMEEKEILSHFLDLYQYHPVLSANLLGRLIDHNLEKGDLAQAEFYSIHYYQSQNRSTLYYYPSHSIKVYINFAKVNFHKNLKAGKVKEAVQEAEKILSITPHLYEFHVGIVNALKKAGLEKESTGYYTKYMSHYEKMIDFSEVNSTALNDWAWSAVLCNRQLELAEKRSRMAVKMAPENANLLDTLAEVLFKKGKIEEAVKVQAKACEFASLSKFSSFRTKLNRFKLALKQ